MASGFNDDPKIPILWKDVPTHYVDGPIGAAWARGMRRILLGELTFNKDGEASLPAVQPVCNLVMSDDTIRDFIVYLKDLIDQRDDE